ncbi:MAG: hypothetical protein LUQ07_01750 [Methanospirillum sp.]|nr:hypothetical protein [Methanospirillum sp.]
MSSHASIRGGSKGDIIPEFLWKYLGSPLEEHSRTSEDQEANTIRNPV